mgnify:CR=1 FL=1
MTPFILRRLKSDVELDLPPKQEVMVYAPLTEQQRRFYEATVDKTINQMLNKDEVRYYHMGLRYSHFHQSATSVRTLSVSDQSVSCEITGLDRSSRVSELNAVFISIYMITYKGFVCTQ